MRFTQKLGFERYSKWPSPNEMENRDTHWGMIFGERKIWPSVPLRKIAGGWGGSHFLAVFGQHGKS